MMNGPVFFTVLLLSAALLSGSSDAFQSSSSVMKLRTSGRSLGLHRTCKLVSDAESIAEPTETTTPLVPVEKTFDLTATVSYIAATSLQWTGMIGFLNILQKGLEASPESIPALDKGIVAIVMLGLSLKSRVFSPLNNQRPSAVQSDPIFKNRKRPSWQPPPLAFPIIWSTIALLRTISATLIYTTTGTLLCTPLFLFMAHLCIGDTWNT
jgi:tryptophan-rich sensory protein